MQKYEEVSKKSRKPSFIDNFLGGIAWGFGTTIGFSLVIAVLSFILNKLNFIPFVGDFVNAVIQYLKTRGTL